MSTQEIARFSVLFPKGTLEKVEKHKGRYISRNKYILRAGEQYLEEDNENNDKQKENGGKSAGDQPEHSTTPEPEPTPVGADISNVQY